VFYLRFFFTTVVLITITPKRQTQNPNPKPSKANASTSIDILTSPQGSTCASAVRTRQHAAPATHALPEERRTGHWTLARISCRLVEPQPRQNNSTIQYNNNTISLRAPRWRIQPRAPRRLVPRAATRPGAAQVPRPDLRTPSSLPASLRFPCRGCVMSPDTDAPLSFKVSYGAC